MNANKNQHCFSIEHMQIPDREEGEAFGAKFAGTFTVRRPTIRDKSDITLHYSAAISKAGGDADPVRLAMIPAVNLTYIFCYLGVVAIDKPDWFNDSKLYEEDETAVYAVYAEVERWLASFRPKATSAGGQQ